jgi:hypothetical protein
MSALSQRFVASCNKAAGSRELAGKAVETSGKRAPYQIEISEAVSAFHYRKAI